MAATVSGAASCCRSASRFGPCATLFVSLFAAAKRPSRPAHSSSARAAQGASAQRDGQHINTKGLGESPYMAQDWQRKLVRDPRAPPRIVQQRLPDAGRGGRAGGQRMGQAGQQVRALADVGVHARVGAGGRAREPPQQRRGALPPVRAPARRQQLCEGLPGASAQEAPPSWEARGRIGGARHRSAARPVASPRKARSTSM